MRTKIKERCKWVCGVIFTTSSVLGAAWFIENRPIKTVEKSEEKRVPASSEQSKQTILRGYELKHKHSFGKPSGLVEVTIQAPGKNSSGDGSVQQLEATVTAQRDLDGLKFNWLLPNDGVEILSGSSQGDLANLREGESTTMHLTIRNSTPENRRVHLHVFKLINGEAMGQMAQYNTVDQDRIEKQARDKSEVLEQQSKVVGVEDLKIIQ